MHIRDKMQFLGKKFQVSKSISRYAVQVTDRLEVTAFGITGCYVIKIQTYITLQDGHSFEAVQYIINAPGEYLNNFSSPVWRSRNILQEFQTIWSHLLDNSEHTVKIGSVTSEDGKDCYFQTNDASEYGIVNSHLLDYVYYNLVISRSTVCPDIVTMGKAITSIESLAPMGREYVEIDERTILSSVSAKGGSSPLELSVLETNPSPPCGSCDS